MQCSRRPVAGGAPAGLPAHPHQAERRAEAGAPLGAARATAATLGAPRLRRRRAPMARPPRFP
eukprot:2330588-Lingulodinium_polyedra.AAC.2